MKKIIENKVKVFLYIGAAIVCGIVAGVVTKVFFNEPFLFMAYWIVAGAMFGAITARTLYHVFKNEYNEEMWCVSICFYAAVGGWVGAILAQSWNWITLFIALTFVGLLMGFGYRYIDKKEAKAVEANLPSEKRLYKTLKFKYVDDKIGNALDKSRPLCLINGKPATVADADKAGQGAIAAEGIEYIRAILAGTKEN